MKQQLQNNPALRRLKNRVKRILPGLSNNPAPVHYTQSYAQVGEDLVLRAIFGDKPSGFYVDVGAHHPERFSVTHLFYLRGWRGINIDAMPGSMEPFNRLRPRDVNLELAVSDRRQVLTYYSFNEPALNGFSKELSLDRDKQNDFQLLSEQKIQTLPLSEILDQYLPIGQTIDILNVDVEGLDYDVLKSNDWSKYRPTIVLAEDTGVDTLTELKQSPLVKMLEDIGYSLHSKVFHTLFFSTATRD